MPAADQRFPTPGGPNTDRNPQPTCAAALLSRARAGQRDCLRAALAAERRAEALAGELRVWAPHVRPGLLGAAVDDEAGITHHDTSRPLDVHGEPGVAHGSIGIDGAGEGVALDQCVPISTYGRIVVDVKDDSIQVAVLVEENLEEAVFGLGEGDREGAARAGWVGAFLGEAEGAPVGRYCCGRCRRQE